MFNEGALGEVRKVVIHDGHKGPKEIGVEPEFFAWLTDPKLDGAGALFDFGCYGADLMTWLMDGKRPRRVTAVTQQIKPDDLSARRRRGHGHPDLSEGAGDHPGVVELAVRSQGHGSLRANGYVITVKRDDVRFRRTQEDKEQLVTAKPVARAVRQFRFLPEGGHYGWGQGRRALIVGN